MSANIVIFYSDDDDDDEDYPGMNDLDFAITILLDLFLSFDDR